MKEEVGYKRLLVYQKAHILVKEIYLSTKTFSRNEEFGLVSQMRRCAVSVPANIIEGYARRTEKELRNFCYIARGSLSELEYYIDLAFDLGYIQKQEYQNLGTLRYEVGKLLGGFIRSIK